MQSGYKNLIVLSNKSFDYSLLIPLLQSLNKLVRLLSLITISFTGDISHANSKNTLFNLSC